MRPISAPSGATDRLRARIAVLLAEPGVAERVRRRLARRTPDPEATLAPLPHGLRAASAAEGRRPPIRADTHPRARDRWAPDAQEAADDRLEHLAI
jgi:hypothetical protein